MLSDRATISLSKDRTWPVPKAHRFGACSFLPVVAVGAAGAIEGLVVVFLKIAVHVYGLFQKESLRWADLNKIRGMQCKIQAGEKDWKD